MRFKINYDSEDYTEALKHNKEKFIQEHQLQDDELAKILVYAIPTALTEQDVASFMLLLNTYKRYLQIKELLDKQGLLVISSTGVPIVNKLLSAEKNQVQLLQAQLRSFGCTLDTRVGLESVKMTESAEENDEVLNLIKSLKE